MTVSEQKYLKQIFLFVLNNNIGITITQLGKQVNVKTPSTFTMIKRLEAKKLIIYNKPTGCKVTAKGRQISQQIIRRHQLGKIFLTKTLKVNIVESNAVANQFQYIESNKLADRLSQYLGNPLS